MDKHKKAIVDAASNPFLDYEILPSEDLSVRRTSYVVVSATPTELKIRLNTDPLRFFTVKVVEHK